MRLIEISGKIELLMAISTKQESNFHPFSQHSYARSHFISAGDKNLTKENSGLHMSLFSFHVWDCQG